MAILISGPLRGSIKSHLRFREGLIENWEVFVVEELLLKFLPATYFGNPLASKLIEGYLLAILLEIDSIFLVYVEFQNHSYVTYRLQLF